MEGCQGRKMVVWEGWAWWCEDCGGAELMQEWRGRLVSGWDGAEQRGKMEHRSYHLS